MVRRRADPPHSAADGGACECLFEGLAELPAHTGHAWPTGAGSAGRGQPLIPPPPASAVKCVADGVSDMLAGARVGVTLLTDPAAPLHNITVNAGAMPAAMAAAVALLPTKGPRRISMPRTPL